MTFAVIADIHGNALALAAVLADIAREREAPGAILHLGDACNGPIDPAGTADVLRQLPNVRHVRGNGDRMVSLPTEPNVVASAQFARAHLSPEDVRWLGQWPQVISGEGWLACHGSPRDDTEYLLERVTDAGVVLREPADIVRRIGPTHATLVLCAHTHIARVVQVPNGPLVVNPGSVGLPAYADEEPYPHTMEAGSPHARYALVERRGEHWHADLRQVTYDWNTSARLAEKNGRPDWARAVRTGRV